MKATFRAVHVVVPADVDDPRVPSGGNTYDRRVCDGLASAGWSVCEVPVAGTWPRPSAAEQAALADSLAALPDDAVVLVDGLVGCGVPDVILPAARRLRIAMLVHMPLADDPSAASLDGLERTTLHAVRLVVATSPWSARCLITHHDLPADRVHAVAPGTDPAPVVPGGADGSRLLCVAALTPGKGQDVLVEALASVADLPWHCVLVGSPDRDPEFAAHVRELVARRHLDRRIELAGPSVGEDLAAHYAAADLVVLASRGETFGMVVIEALARGIPVLATSVGALPDTLGRAADGTVPGLLVRPDDVGALGRALRRWLTEPGLRDRLRAAAGYRRAAVGDWSGTARSMADVLARLA